MRLSPLFAGGVLFLTGCIGLQLGDTPTPGAVPPGGESANPVRVLAIPQEEHGYAGFKSQVIDSREQFNAFKATAENQTGWNDRASFLRVLEQACISFDRESLVLIRQADGSGSQSVSLGTWWLWGGTLHCPVRVTDHSPSTRDMQYRCFAVVVEKRKVARVEVRVKEGWTSTLRETLAVGNPTPSAQPTGSKQEPTPAVQLTNFEDYPQYVGKRVEVVGVVTNTKCPQVCGIDVWSLDAHRGKRVRLRGTLRESVVTQESIDRMWQSGNVVANRGAGRFYSLDGMEFEVLP